MQSTSLLSSSLRVTPPEVTLAHAKKYAARLGITRVTDITRLDRVGLPVFVSIRPAALPGSICVNAGKGARSIEAEVGAYMEAIEYAMAEPGASNIPIVRSKARYVLDGAKRHDAILDLCPRLKTPVVLDAAMSCVEAKEIGGRGRALVPAELVFFPFTPPAGQQGYFGSSTNGIASGNSLQEAIVHGLCELIERDICSFQAVRDTSVLVDLASVRGHAEPLVDIIREGGLHLFLRVVPNVFGIPFFSAIVHDPDSRSPHLLNAGYGCHPHRSIAAVRAISEAAQSRLSFIHGGRDDLLQRHDRFRSWRPARKHAHIRRIVAAAARGAERAVRFDDIDDFSAVATDIAGCEKLLLERLRDCGIDRAYFVAFGSTRAALQVVRVLVPGLEAFNETSQRVGRRLREHARAN